MKNIRYLFFVGLMPAVIAAAAFMCVNYGLKHDNPNAAPVSPILAIAGEIMITFFAWYFSLMLFSRFSGRKVDFSDAGFIAQFFGSIGVWIMNIIVIGVMIFLLRSCH